MSEADTEYYDSLAKMAIYGPRQFRFRRFLFWVRLQELVHIVRMDWSRHHDWHTLEWMSAGKAEAVKAYMTLTGFKVVS